MRSHDLSNVEQIFNTNYKSPLQNIQAFLGFPWLLLWVKWLTLVATSLTSRLPLLIMCIGGPAGQFLLRPGHDCLQLLSATDYLPARAVRFMLALA